MILTGKCKEDFEAWGLVNNKELLKYSEERYSEVIDMSQLFNYLTDSMQYGLLVDFFDSVGVRVELMKHKLDDLWGCYIEGVIQGARIKTRQEARIKAIEKAVEIYNKTYLLKQIIKPNVNVL